MHLDGYWFFHILGVSLFSALVILKSILIGFSSNWRRGGKMARIWLVLRDGHQTVAKCSGVDKPLWHRLFGAFMTFGGTHHQES